MFGLIMLAVMITDAHGPRYMPHAAVAVIEGGLRFSANILDLSNALLNGCGYVIRHGYVETLSVISGQTPDNSIAQVLSYTTFIGCRIMS